MHIRFILLTFFISFCHFSVQGQGYEISLSKQSIDLSAGKFYVSDRVGANFTKGFKPELMDFFSKNLPAQHNLQPVILKILKFQISENTGLATEAAKAEVAIDFIYQQNDKYYQLFRGIGVAKKNSGLDVTGSHDNNIKAAIEQCFRQFERQDIAHYMATANALSWQEVSKDFLATLETHNYPILTDSATKKGIYRSFLDFRNNQPLSVQNLLVEKVTRESRNLRNIYEVRPFLTEPDGSKKLLKNVWGFSDGENVYVHFNKDYFLMDRDGNTFSFYGYGPMNNNSPAVAAGAVAGGMIGGAVVAVATQRATQAEYIVDMMSGQIVSVDNARVEVINSHAAEYPAKIALYWWSGAPASQALNVYVNDSLMYTIQPKSLIEIEWENMSTEIKICLKDQQEACFTFIPNFKKINYIECGLITKGGASRPDIKPVDAKEGEFYVKKIKYLQDKEKK
jgi:hypothetical protein